MPRVHTIAKSRKPHKCARCTKTIKVGEGYKHWSFRYGGKVIRCLSCPHPRPSELTQSDKLSRLYACDENIQDGLGATTCAALTPDEFSTYRDAIKTIVEEAAEEAREVTDEYEEALEAWEHGNSQIEEAKDAAETYADELESAVQEIEGVDVEIEDDMTEADIEEAVQAAIDEVDNAASNPSY